MCSDSTPELPNGSPNDDDAIKSAKTGQQALSEALMERDEEFWFEDGTVILVAGNVEFRVYKGTLAKVSPVFFDMFTLPQPVSSDLNDAVTPSTKCPVVRLEGDSPTALRHVLRVLFPLNPTPWVLAPEPPTFHMLYACARLGHKYQIESLIRQITGYLSQQFTTRYAAWEEASDYVPKGFKLEHAIGVIHIARLLDCPLLLPTAFLVCCHANEDRLMQGFQDEDGIVVTLDAADLARLLRGQKKLLKVSFATALQVFAPVPPSLPTAEGVTQSHDGCSRRLRDRLHAADLLSDEETFLNPFNVWTVIRGYPLYKDLQVCTRCHKVLAERYRKAIMDYWNRLPGIFDLTVKGWEDETRAK